MQLAHFINLDVSIKDTTSMLFYWADRDYLKIIEEEPDKKGKSEYKIRKLKELPSGLDKSERKMFESYFHNVSIDEYITLTDLDAKFIERRQKAIEKVLEYFVSKNNTELVEPKSKKAKNKILALAAITFFIFTILSLPTLPILTKLITSAVSLIFNIIIYIFISIFFSRIINLASTKKTSKKVSNLLISILIFVGLLIINMAILIIICNFKFTQTNLLIKFALIPTGSFYILAILSALTEKRSVYATQTFGKIFGLQIIYLIC